MIKESWCVGRPKATHTQRCSHGLGVNPDRVVVLVLVVVPVEVVVDVGVLDVV